MRGEWLKGACATLRPPKRISLSEWADQYFYLSADSSAEPGRWRTLPYQRGVMDAITDPNTTFITWMKSARIGYTKCVNACVAYYIHQDPCAIMVVQPKVGGAEKYSKEEIAPMLRDVPVLRDRMTETRGRVSGNTILHKGFIGGSVSMIGAESGSGFRSVSRRVVVFDEVDGYSPSAGDDGDQIKLGMKRAECFWNRKIIAGSTPKIAGASRIEPMFLAGDQRRYHVPCSQCGHMDYLVFRPGDRGHCMKWPKDKPEEAYFLCSSGDGCVIQESDKHAMIGAGEWIAERPFDGHASFHLWAAYSPFPNVTWGSIASEFVDAKGNSHLLQTFVNLTLGETWTERGDSPDWEVAYGKREQYEIGTVPDGVEFLTCGVDVQKDRIVYEVVGWARSKESWSIDAGIILGVPSTPEPWAELSELLERPFPGSAGNFVIRLMAVDAGYEHNIVYNWCRGYSMRRVVAVLGIPTAKTMTGVPKPVDVTVRGRTHRRGYKYQPVGGAIAKQEFYGWMKLPVPLDGAPPPPGYCHFPNYPAEVFRQLTSEHLVPEQTRTGHTKHVWKIKPGFENHWLDCRVYARVAAAIFGLDRARPLNPPPTAKALTPPAPVRQQEPPPRQKRKPRKSGFGGDDWFKDN